MQTVTTMNDLGFELKSTDTASIKTGILLIYEKKKKIHGNFSSFRQQKLQEMHSPQYLQTGIVNNNKIFAQFSYFYVKNQNDNLFPPY